MLDLFIYVRGVFALLTFVINSTLLILYFSTIIGYSHKLTLHKEAFKIALPGTFLTSILIFLNSWIPKLLPVGPLSSSIDIGISGSIILWTILTRRYCETDWLSTIAISFVASMMYIIVMLFVYLLLLLTIKAFPL